MNGVDSGGGDGFVLGAGIRGACDSDVTAIDVEIGVEAAVGIGSGVGAGIEVGVEASIGVGI